jgi:beta-glucosidase
MTVTFPEGFVWGVAAAAHQIEGGNSNNDWWAFEHQEGTPCLEPSGDCCDSYHRYDEDIAIIRDLGFSAYRFSIEWSRIEPEDGEFSRAALDYYRRVIAECHEQGVQPVVTFHHFSNPRWVAAMGGWESEAIVERFARYCERTVAHLGDLIPMACTINEPNVVSLIGYRVGAFPPGKQDAKLVPIVNDNLKAAHRRAVEVLKAGRGDFPVGWCVSMEDWWHPRVPRSCSNARATRTKGNISKTQRATTSSASRRTRARASARPANRWGPKKVSSSYRRWGTSSGRRRSKLRSGTPPMSRSCPCT